MELNKIYNENCLTTMGNMPDNFIDLVVTSPPYDSIRDYKGYSFEFESIAKELYRIIKQGGIVVWVVGDQIIDGSESLTSFEQALYFKNECGFKVHDTMIYQKNSFAFPEKVRYHQMFEYMFVLCKGKPKTFNPIKDVPIKYKESWGTHRGRGKDGELKFKKDRISCHEFATRSNLWIYANGGCGMSSSDKVAFEHPAIFPEGIAQDHIISWSNPKEIVYDPFLGSGTTAKMAILLDRQWIGSEMSAEYCDIAERRLKPYMAQYKLGI